MWIGYEFFLFVIGLAALLWGAERLVGSASHLAIKYKVNPLIIGLTILSIGTSLPEIATSITSFVTGHADIAIGNIVGSELVQITLILGLVAFIRPLKGKRNEIIFYGISMIIAVMLAFLVIKDNVITWYEGLFLVIVYIGYLFYIVKKDKKITDNKPKKTKKTWKNLAFFIILGTALTILGSKLIVDSTVEISRYFGVSEYIIAVFLVGLGTSLPELVVSGIAAWKKEYSMSIGNLLGSNITDPTLSLGIGAIFVNKAAINPVASLSILYLIGIFALVTLLFAWRKKIGRIEASLIILLYIVSFWLF